MKHLKKFIRLMFLCMYIALIPISLLIKNNFSYFLFTISMLMAIIMFATNMLDDY